MIESPERKLWKVQRQKVSHSDKEYCSVSYAEKI